MAILSREQFEAAMRQILGPRGYDAVERGLELGVKAAAGVRAQPRASTPTPTRTNVSWGEQAPPTDEPTWGEPPTGPDYSRGASAGVQSASEMPTWGQPRVGETDITNRYHSEVGPRYHSNVAPRESEIALDQWGRTPGEAHRQAISDQMAEANEMGTRYHSEVQPRAATGDGWQEWLTSEEGRRELADAKDFMASGTERRQEQATPAGSTASATPGGFPAGSWEAAFQAEHGRAPTSYDRRVKDEMDNWVRSGYASPQPTRGDWERLTTSLNRKGIYGPREVPEFAPGYGPNANPALRAPLPAARVSTGMTSEAANDYFRQEFRSKQGITHPLEGQGAMVVSVANQYGITPERLLAGIEYVAGGGKPVKTQSDVIQMAQLLKQKPPEPQVLAIEQAIKQHYGPIQRDSWTAIAKREIDDPQDLKQLLDRYAPFGDNRRMLLALAAQRDGVAAADALAAKQRVLSGETAESVRRTMESTEARLKQQLGRTPTTKEIEQSLIGSGEQTNRQAIASLQGDLFGGGTQTSRQEELGQYTNQPNGIGRPASITEQGIGAYLAKEYPNSPLRGAARAIATAGATHNVDPTTLLAIMEKESGLMSVKGVGTQGNNPGSLAYGSRDDAVWLGANPDKSVRGADGGKFLYFETPQAGVNALAKLLGEGRYAREGRRTWGSLNDVFSSTKRGDSPTWAEEVGRTAANIKQYYGGQKQ